MEQLADATETRDNSTTTTTETTTTPLLPFSSKFESRESKTVTPGMWTTTTVWTRTKENSEPTVVSSWEFTTFAVTFCIAIVLLALITAGVYMWTKMQDESKI